MFHFHQPIDTFLTWLALDVCSSGNWVFIQFSNWRLSEISTNVGFAIGSPGTPRDVCASDQIRAHQGHCL
jgi:hypothetical protein